MKADWDSANNILMDLNAFPASLTRSKKNFTVFILRGSDLKETNCMANRLFWSPWWAGLKYPTVQVAEFHQTYFDIWTIVNCDCTQLYFLRSFCLKALRSRPSCAKLCRLTVKVKAVLRSWVNGLSAPQNGKSGWGNPLRLKNDIYKKVLIFDLKKQAKSLILAPEDFNLHWFDYFYAVGY